LAQEIFDSPPFQPLRDDILDLLNQVPVAQLARPKRRTRSGKTYVFPVDQKALNALIRAEFVARGWEPEPWIVADRGTQLKADYKKDRVRVEVQFGNIARVIYDLFKLQVSYAQDLIDVGVIVVPVQALAREIDENVAYFERVRRELQYARMSITLPVWLIGVSA
jgi:hypothetical protein